MKFTIDTTKFYNAINNASAFVSRTPVNPIFASIKIEVIDAETIRISSIDMDARFSTNIKAMVECNDEKSFCISASKIQSISSAMAKKKNEAVIELSEDKKTINARCGSFESTVPVLDSTLFPEDESYSLQDEKYIKIKECELSSRILQASFAKTPMVKGSVVPLCGLLVSLRGSSLTFVSTDGKRVSTSDAFVENEDNEWDFIIPPMTIGKITKAFSGISSDYMLDISIFENHMIIQDGTTRITFSSLEGLYPNYRKVIPSGYTDKISFDRKEMIASIENIMAVCPTAKIIKLSTNGMMIDLSSESSEEGKANDSVLINVEDSNYDTINICVAPNIIIEGLKNEKCDIATLEFAHGEKHCFSPVVMQDGFGFKYVFMPCKP